MGVGIIPGGLVTRDGKKKTTTSKQRETSHGAVAFIEKERGHGKTGRPGKKKNNRQGGLLRQRGNRLEMIATSPHCRVDKPVGGQERKSETRVALSSYTLNSLYLIFLLPFFNFFFFFFLTRCGKCGCHDCFVFFARHHLQTLSVLPDPFGRRRQGVQSASKFGHHGSSLAVVHRRLLRPFKHNQFDIMKRSF